MMIKRVVIIACAVAALWFGWRWAFPSDEVQIHGVLDRIAKAAGSGAVGESDVARITRSMSIRSALDPAITVDAGPPFHTTSGRDVLIGTVARLNNTMKDLEIRFADVQISVDPSRTSATVYATAEALFHDARGDRGLEARELDLTFRRLEGDWVVSRVAPVHTLRPVVPE
jgi:hypothetical protein